jgi:hypothetical protein
MPSADQKRTVREEITALEHSAFPADGDASEPLAERSDHALFWSELSEYRKIKALQDSINWRGFSPEQAIDVIQNVIDGKDRWHWMDGIGSEKEDRKDGQKAEGMSDEPIRPLTQELIDCCRLDVWPGLATVTDFGIESSSHLGAIQHALILETVTPAELDAAMGSGEKLTEIARRGQNPYGNVVFKTAWDDMPREEGVEDREFTPPGASTALGDVMQAVGNSPLPDSIRDMETDYHRMMEQAAERPVNQDKGIKR